MALIIIVILIILLSKEKFEMFWADPNKTDGEKKRVGLTILITACVLALLFGIASAGN